MAGALLHVLCSYAQQTNIALLVSTNTVELSSYPILNLSEGVSVTKAVATKEPQDFIDQMSFTTDLFKQSERGKMKTDVRRSAPGSNAFFLIMEIAYTNRPSTAPETLKLTKENIFLADAAGQKIKPCFSALVFGSAGLEAWQNLIASETLREGHQSQMLFKVRDDQLEGLRLTYDNRTMPFEVVKSK